MFVIRMYYIGGYVNKFRLKLVLMAHLKTCHVKLIFIQIGPL